MLQALAKLDVISFLSNTLSDVLWLALGALGALIVRLSGTLGRRAQMRRAFGANVHTADDIAFYLPLWRVQDRNRGETRFTKQSLSGEAAHYYGPDRTFAEEDTKSAFEASQAFARFFSRPIDIRPDDERLRESETALLIGSSVANRHAASVIAMYQCDLPGQLPIDFPAIEENDETKAAFFIRNNATGEEYRFNGLLDFAFVLRLPKIEDGEGNHFIIGGIDASGTQAAGAVLRRRWKMFAKHKGPMALIISLQRGQPETCRLLLSVFRRGNAWRSKPGKA